MLHLVLLFEMLKDQHVRIDRHTNGEDDARHARERQGRIHQIENAEQQDRVCHERHIRDKSRQMIEQYHEKDDCAETDGKCELGFILRVLSERRTNGARLDDLHLDRERTAAQDDREVLRLFERLLPRDLRTPSENRLADVRRGQHLAVEQDGDRTPDVAHRKIGKFLRALVGELEIDDVLSRLRIRRRLRVLEIRSRQHRIAVLVTELEHRRLADRTDRSVGVFDARQFDDDAPLALALNDRLGQTERVDALFHNCHNAVHRIVIHLCLLRVHGFEHNVRAALEIQPLANRTRERLNECKEHADNDGDRDHELEQTMLSQSSSHLFLKGLIIPPPVRAQKAPLRQDAVHISVV